MFSSVSSFKVNFSFYCRITSTTSCWKISFFSCCFSNFFLNAGSWLSSLVGLLLVYLEPNSLKTLHSYNEYSGPWIRQVSCDQSFIKSTHLFLCLTSLVIISEYDFDDEDSPLIWLMWPKRLESAPFESYKKVLHHLINIFRNFHAFRHIFIL